MEKVSICIPTFNGEKFLSESIESAIAQTGSYELEIIINDDCSSDKTFEIARNYQVAYPNIIKIYRNEQNLGLVNNWNQTLKMATGNWIHLLFQDDFLNPGATEECMQLAQNKNCRMVLFDRNYLFAEDVPKRRKFLQNLTRITVEYPDQIVEPPLITELLKHNFIKNFIGEPVCALMHKSIFNDYGNYDNSLRQICDLEYFLRVSLNEPIYIHSGILVNFRVHADSQTAKNSKRDLLEGYFADRLTIFNKLLKNPDFSFVQHPPHRQEFIKLIEGTLKRILNKYGYFRVVRYIKPNSELSVILAKIIRKKPIYLLRGFF